MKPVWVVLSVIAALVLSACGAQPSPTATEAAPAAATSPQILKTTMGDFAIVSARLVDEAHDTNAPQGEKFLLIGLAQSDLQPLVAGEFSLETFQSSIQQGKNEVYVLGADGSQTFYTSMGGWIDDDFVIGFRVPVGDSFTLYWTGNDPIPLTLQE
jgi:hypothetical protein